MRRTMLLVVAGIVLSSVILPAAGRQSPPTALAQPMRLATAAGPVSRDTVVVEATIGPDGSVSAVKLLRGPAELGEAAQEAVRYWTFEPTLLNGAPVPVIMTASVGFAGDNNTRIPVTAYVDRTGRASIHGPFTVADEFSGGLAAVRIGDGTSSRYGYIDTGGRAVIKPLFVAAGRFSEGLAAVVVDGAPPARWGYIDARGTVAIPPQFAAAGVFADGLAAVKVGDGSAGAWGYVDRTGRLAIDPQFSYAERFADGLAPVRVGNAKSGKWGYIDRAGRFVVAAQFRLARGFASGLAPVLSFK